MSLPTKNDAILIFQKVIGLEVAEIMRFPTGTQNFVYDVLASNHQRYVVRIGASENRDHFAGAAFWHTILVELGIPVPRYYFCEVEQKLFEFPVIIMERLAGKDLGQLYNTLTSSDKKQLAHDIISIQKRVATLPTSTGFGYAKSFADNELKPSWLELIREQLERTRTRTIDAGVVDLEYVNQVTLQVNEQKEQLAKVRPIAFLDDTTTKNVIIARGKLSGIVDTDFVCYGDPLYVVALTKMALLSSGYDTDYTDFWCSELSLNEEQESLLKLYTKIHCVGFMSELGHRFNANSLVKVDNLEVEKLVRIFNTLMS